MSKGGYASSIEYQQWRRADVDIQRFMETFKIQFCKFKTQAKSDKQITNALYMQVYKLISLYVNL